MNRLESNNNNSPCTMSISELKATLPSFLQHLYQEEYAYNSINGYKKDLMGLFSFLEQNFCTACMLEKDHLIAYKQSQSATLKPASINRKIAAINKFMIFCNLPSFKLKALKIQERTTTENTLTEREFSQLINNAITLGKQKIALIMLTLAATGIRISELKYITAETAKAGKITINNKGKVRLVIIPKYLKEHLTTYCQKHKIKGGTIFLGKTGRPISRPYVSVEMKSIAHACGVDTSKAFPHNLRHYFARKFLDCGNPLPDLADVLGHVSINTTRRYLRVSERVLRRRMSKVKLLSQARAADFFALWAG